MPKHQSEFTLYPRKVATFLASILLFFVFAHLIVNWFHSAIGNDLTYYLKRFFDLDGERNAPTLFSISLFVINAILFLMVWKAQWVRNTPQRMWIILSGLFCFLALDELSSIHERLVGPLRSALGASGFFFYAWIIPYGIAVLLLSIYVIPVIWRIDKKIRFWFILSAVTFITGAIGIEMIEGWYLEKMNYVRDFLFYLLFTIEETLEMVGLVMLVYALMTLIQTTYGGFSINISSVNSASQSKAR